MPYWVPGCSRAIVGPPDSKFEMFPALPVNRRGVGIKYRGQLVTVDAEDDPVNGKNADPDEVELDNFGSNK